VQGSFCSAKWTLVAEVRQELSLTLFYDSGIAIQTQGLPAVVDIAVIANFPSTSSTAVGFC
jgi:hypothetical protein